MSQPTSGAANSAREKNLATIAIICLIFITSALFVQVISPRGPATTPDSIAYLELAQGIQNGHGSARAERALHDLGENKYRAVSDWPPLYPALIALASKNESSTLQSVSFLSGILLGITLVCIYFLLTTVMATQTALLFTLASCWTMPVLVNYAYVWSETLFFALYTSMLWVVVCYELCSQSETLKRNFLLLALVLLSAAAFYTRYIGGITLFVFVYLAVFGTHRRRDQWKLVALGFIALLSMLFLLYINNVRTGFFTGNRKLSAEQHEGLLLSDLVSTIQILVPGNQGPLLACLVAAGVLVVGVEYRNSPKLQLREEYADRQRVACRISLAFVIVYTSAILFARYIMNFDRIDMRLLGPAFPALWVFLATLSQLSMPEKISRTGIRFLAFSLLFALLLQGSFFFTSIRDAIASDLAPRYPAKSGAIYTNFTQVRTSGVLPSLLASNLRKPSIVATRKPEIVEFWTSIPAVKLPKNYDVTFLEELLTAAASGSASLLFFKSRELERFEELMGASTLDYDVLDTREGFFVHFGEKN